LPWAMSSGTILGASVPGARREMTPGGVGSLLGKKLLVFLAAAVFTLASGSLVPARAAIPAPHPAARSAVLIDGSTGQVLWSKNPEEPLYPASTTKILTALIAIQKGNLNDVITIPGNAVGVEGSSIGLQLGETFTLKNLLYCLLLVSANDAAVAIADHIGGSVPAFVHMMNDEARRLGAVHSHFANPNGLYNPDHYVTAGDLAIIARAAMTNPVFRQIVATRYYTLPPRPNPRSQRYLVNHNRLLWTYPGCVGIKDGYIVKSNETFVAAADRDGRELIAVVLDSPPGSVYSDETSLLNYGFAAFTRREIARPEQAVSRVPVRFSGGGVDLVPVRPVYYDFPVAATPDVERRVEVQQPLTAPLRRGQQVGELVLSWQGREIGRVPLVAAQEVNRMLYADWFFWLVVVLAAVAGAYVYVVRVLAGKRYRFRPRCRLPRR